MAAVGVDGMCRLEPRGFIGVAGKTPIAAPGVIGRIPLGVLKVLSAGVLGKNMLPTLGVPGKPVSTFGVDGINRRPAVGVMGRVPIPPPSLGVLGIILRGFGVDGIIPSTLSFLKPFSSSSFALGSKTKGIGVGGVLQAGVAGVVLTPSGVGGAGVWFGNCPGMKAAMPGVPGALRKNG